MKLLVTGGAGFIGSEFIRYWLGKHQNDEITNLDLLTYASNKESLNEVKDTPNYTFVKGDIRDPKTVDPLVKDCDKIIHFAAESHNDRAIQDLTDFLRTNINGTYILLEAAKKHKKHIHHISTDEVFGHLELNTDEKFTEQTPYAPRMPYAATKAASDHLVRSYYETHGVSISITNCANNFGPYQNPEKFIPRMITNLIDGENIKIYGDGLYVRDWLHVQDHARAIEVVVKDGQPGDTYLVGGMTKDVNNLDVAKLILKHMNLGEDKIEFVKDRPGHDRRYAVDWSKIKAELNWEPEHTFEDWLKETINWYQANEDWWRPLKDDAEKLYKQTGQ